MYLVLLLVTSSFCCRCTVSKELHFHCEKDLVTHVPGFCSHLHSSLWQARQRRSCMCLAVTIFCHTRLNFNRTFCRSKFLHESSLQVPMQISADIPGWRLWQSLPSPERDVFGPLALGRYLYPAERPCWGWEVSRLLAQSSGTVYQPLCELQLSPLWHSLDIWRPTCLADRQRIWGLFMMRSTNPLIIIIIISPLTFEA